MSKPRSVGSGVAGPTASHLRWAHWFVLWELEETTDEIVYRGKLKDSTIIVYRETLATVRSAPSCRPLDTLPPGHAALLSAMCVTGPRRCTWLLQVPRRGRAWPALTISAKASCPTSSLTLTTSSSSSTATHPVRSLRPPPRSLAAPEDKTQMPADTDAAATLNLVEMRKESNIALRL